MAKPDGMTIADWGIEPCADTRYLEATIQWSDPVTWGRSNTLPPLSDDNGLVYLYAIGKSCIEYVGITEGGRSRFYNHARAQELRARGGLHICQGFVTFRGEASRKASGAYIRTALEQIEHILIWAIPDLANQKKQLSIPLLQTQNNGDSVPWVIHNVGYPFGGELPRKIVYPWMLVDPRPPLPA